MAPSDNSRLRRVGSFDTGITELHDTARAIAARRRAQEHAMAIIAELEPDTTPIGAPRRPAPAPPPTARSVSVPVVELEPSALGPMPAPPLIEASGDGQVLAVFPCRGGAGATTIAVNTAAALGRAGRRVCLIDLDLQLGDACAALGLDAGASLTAVARHAAHLDGPALARRMLRHRSGVFVLSQVGAPEDIDERLAERLPGLLFTLRRHFDHVIVDGLRDFSALALAALDACDRVALVLPRDVPAVRRADRVLTLVRRLGHADRIALLLNHAGRRGAEARLARMLACPIAGRVRRDHRRATAAFRDGEPLVTRDPRAGIARDLAALIPAIAPGGAGARGRRCDGCKQLT